MASIKNITRKLVNAGFSEDKLMMMTEKEIREAYKDYKVVKEEVAMNNNNTKVNNTAKEEIVMVKEMKQLVRNYDCFTQYIENYNQKKEAENHNHELTVKFVEVANKMGINATKDDLYEIASSDKSIDEAIEAYIKSHEIKVVSSTLTEQNRELTFIELSPEQKIQISAILSAQIQDVNYSSWFEEENGVFKLYGGWVDEDSAVKEEYYFNSNKLIKIEREEIDMNNNATAIKEEITMKEMRGTDIFFEFKEDFSLVETWADAWVDYNTEENEKLIKEVTNTRYPLALQAAKIAIKNIDPEKTMSYRVLSADRKFWCDCGLGATNTIIVKTACALDGDDPKIKNGYGRIHDFKTGVEAKEEVIMKNNNATTKEKETMITETTVQEEMTMEALIKRLTENKKVQDKGYIKKDDLRIILNEQFGFNFNNKSTRTEMVEALMNKYKDSLKIVDDNENITEDNSVSVGDFCRDNAPESIEEPPMFVLDTEMAAKILERVICQADTNKAHNFISNWMLTSAISEVLFGTPLKEKKNGNVIEYWKGFSKKQNEVLAFIHREFVRKSGFVTKKKGSTIVGYVIPAKVLVWGRHKYLNKACTYKVVGKDGKPLAEYLVSVNGIKNATTGKTMSLTEDDYNTLDTKCVFIK